MSAVELPPSLFDLLGGQRIESRIGLTFLLATADADGVPHLAMLSIGELYAPSRSTLHLALHAGSGSRGALADNGHGLVSVILGTTAYQVRIRAEAAGLSDDRTISYFRAPVTAVREENAPYATITSGITFRLHDPEPTVDRWQRQVDVLRGL